MNLGKYQLTARLGTGGMAEVYLARLAGIGGFDKQVVIKSILPNFVGEEEFVRMFLDEARVAANLNHPNIVQIFEIDQVNGLPFIVMEYVNGPSYAHVLKAAKRAGKLLIGHSARVLAGVCRALHHAHEAADRDGQPLHLVHRDVSPHNVLLTRTGVPKLTDFGIAKSRGRLAATQVGSGLKGKLRYMAPEQIRRADEIDRRVDVFAVGVCLYQATVGKMPFSADSEANLLQSIVEGRYPEPAEMVPSFPPDLDRIIGRALQRDRNLRTPDCKVLAEELEAFASTPPYAAGSEEVAAWIKELVPPVDEQRLTGTGQSLTPSGPSGFSMSPAQLFALTPPGAASQTPSPSGSGKSGPGSHSGSGRSGAGSRGGAVLGSFSRPGVQPTRTSGNFARIPSATPSPAGPTLPRARRWPMLVAGGVAAAAIGVAVALWQSRRVEPVPTPTPPPPAVNAERESLRGYLDAADRLYQQKRYGPALEMLEKAREMKARDPALDLRLIQLTDDVEKSALLASAQRALEMNDPDRARADAKRLLDRDPDHAEALAILAKLRGTKKVVQPGEPARPEKREQPGRLSVTSEPPARVFIDDEPVGQTPLVGLKVDPGRHALELRLAGFQPAMRALRISPGKAESLHLKLVKEEEERKTLLPAELESVATKPVTSPEPPKPPPIEPPKKPEETVVAVKPPQKPLEPEKPPPEETAARAPYVPRLPAHYGVGTLKELLKLMQTVEQEAINGGVPANQARGVTTSIAKELMREVAPGRTLEIFPRPMYDMILAMASQGQGRDAIGAALLQAHREGSLRK
ncbi:MAG: protein kinase [Myxococcales bacterium]|nr:protein kinase [Myxococcales bacterium]